MSTECEINAAEKEIQSVKADKEKLQEGGGGVIIFLVRCYFLVRVVFLLRLALLKGYSE